MSKSAPNSSIESTDNKQIVSRMSTNRSVVSPLDQWQNRMPFINANYNIDHNSRPVLNQSFPNVGFQRCFTPRSSYFGPQNITITSNPSIGPNSGYNHLYNNSNYGSNETQIRDTNNMIHVFHNNRPVYMTPDSNPNNNTINIDFDLLKNVSQIINKSLAQNSSDDQQKSESPQSTINNVSNDSTSKMQTLIQQMKKLSQEEVTNRDIRIEVENKLTQLDEELKDYEQKIQLREQLRKIKNELNLKEEEIVKKRMKVISQMEKYNQSSHSSVNECFSSPIISSNTSEVTHKPTERTTVNVTLNKDIHKKEESTHDRPALKRPIIPSTKSTPVKKVKTDDKISSDLKKEVNKLAKNSPKIGEKHPLKRPFIPKPAPKPSETQSPKINRLCRQQTPTVATSGVRTSRPQKLSSSRKTVAVNDSQQQTPNARKSSDELQNPVKSSETSESSHKPSTDNDSDSEVFDELTKCVTDCESTTSMASAMTESASDQKMSTDSNPEDSHENSSESKKTNDVKSVEIEGNIVEKTHEKSDDSNEVINNSESVVQSIGESCGPTIASNGLKDKAIEIVDIDDEDEECVSTPIERVKIKVEIPDNESLIIRSQLELAEEERIKNVIKAANQLISDEIKDALRLNPKISDGSCAHSDSSGEQTPQKTIKKNNEVFKTPVMPSFKRPKFKYFGFKPEEYPPTVNYSINSFKAIAGPKSKTSKSTVIFLKSFKNYLFASFFDCTLRRYHIENKDDVIKYEGHEELVLSLIVCRQNRASDTFYLLTGCKDQYLRSFDVMSGELLFKLKLNEEVVCLDFCWSHIFAGLRDGYLCKINIFNETISENESETNVQKFNVALGKRISAIKAISNEANDTNCEAVLIVSNTRIRIVNTISSLKDEERILHSLTVNFSLPIYMQLYENHLFVSFKMPTIKSEDKTKKEENSKILIYDLQKVFN